MKTELLERSTLQQAIADAHQWRGISTNHLYEWREGEVCEAESHWQALMDLGMAGMSGMGLDEFNVVRAPGVLVYTKEEGTFTRAHYVTNDPPALAKALTVLPRRRPTIMDVLRRVDQPDNLEILDACTHAGFDRLTSYIKMRCPKLRTYGAAQSGSTATPDHVEAVAELLAEVFDPMSDHLEPLGRLQWLVKQGQVFVAGGPERVDVAAVYEIEGNMAHWRFWAARPGTSPGRVLKVMRDFFADLDRRGIREGFLWVDVRKKQHMQTYQRLGFQPDGWESVTFLGEPYDPRSS